VIQLGKGGFQVRQFNKRTWDVFPLPVGHFWHYAYHEVEVLPGANLIDFFMGLATQFSKSELNALSEISHSNIGELLTFVSVPPREQQDVRIVVSRVISVFPSDNRAPMLDFSVDVSAFYPKDDNPSSLGMLPINQLALCPLVVKHEADIQFGPDSGHLRVQAPITFLDLAWALLSEHYAEPDAKPFRV
jgi:hypothetical protein